MKQYHYIHIFFTILVTILMICCLLDYCSNIETYSVKTNLTQFKKNNDPNDNSTITHVDIPKLKKSVKQLKKLNNPNPNSCQSYSLSVPVSWCQTVCNSNPPYCPSSICSPNCRTVTPTPITPTPITPTPVTPTPVTPTPVTPTPVTPTPVTPTPVTPTPVTPTPITPTPVTPTPVTPSPVGPSPVGPSPSGSISGEWEVCNFTTYGTSGWPSKKDGSDASCDRATLDVIKSKCSSEKYHKPYKPIDSSLCGAPDKPGFPEGKNMCILHGSWGNWDDGPTCTIGNSKTRNFGETSKIWYDTFHQNGGSTTQNVFLCLNDPVTKQPIKAAMSIGHGVLDGICGDLALIKFKDRYLINYQTGPRAWSLELSQPGIGYLDPEGQAGGTCDVPDVMKLEWNDIYNNGKLPVCP